MTIANCSLKSSGILTSSLKMILFILQKAGFYEGHAHRT